MIPREFIDELLARIDIVDIIDQYVPLKKGGANYMACCPFHQEKSPSFSVSATKQFYHCFGCGVHGSALNFVMEYQGLSFIDAVQYLADKVGLTVPHIYGAKDNAEQRAQRKQQQQTLETALQIAADFFIQQLQQCPHAQTYLQQRGLSDDIIAYYGLGYAPESWQALAQAFQPYPNQALIDGGMVIDNDGKQYDRFRHRIMFPIRDVGGKIIGFGGRVLDDSKPKYLNSPDTSLFDKGKNLYGLYEARHAIRQKGKILVVEGYMDVVALAQFGIEYAVAALGTATTSEHIKILMRQADNVYFCFDGDAAGQKAAWRALENALPHLKDGKSLHFLLLPENHDPDSYIRAYGKSQFEDALLHQSKPLSIYFWDSLTARMDLNTQEGKAQLLNSATPLLAQINAPALRFLLKQELGEKIGIDAGSLAQLMGEAAPAYRPQAQNYKLPRQSFRPPETLSLVQKQIRTLLFNPDWAQWVIFPDYVHIDGDFACLVAVAEFYRVHSHCTIAQLLEHFRQTPFENLLNYLFKNSQWIIELDGGCQDGFIQDMNRLIVELKNKQIEQLKNQNIQQGLNEQEKRLLLRLIMSR